MLALSQGYPEHFAILCYLLLVEKRNTKNPANKQALAAESVVPFKAIYTCTHQTKWSFQLTCLFLPLFLCFWNEKFCHCFDMGPNIGSGASSVKKS